MAQTPSTWDDYVGDGVEDTFQVTFPYQKQQEVFVTVDGAPAAFTFISAGWVQLAAAPASGAAIRVQRSTAAFGPRHEFENGVPLLPRFIDENNKQFLYVVQEAVNETVGVAADALNGAEEALNGAEEARDIAQAASDKVDAAVIESAHQLRLDLSNAIDPDKGAKLIGYKGSTVAQKLDGLGTAAIRNAQVSPTDATAGALMAVGAFGLGGANVGISNTNLNTLSKTGFYMGSNLVNAPRASAEWFYVLHQEHGAAGRSSQIAIDMVSPTPKTYQRLRLGGTWYPWQELLHTGNLLQTTGDSTDFPMSQAAVTNAINSSSIGVGQTWQDVTASRAFATTYTNTTGRPITVNVGTVGVTNTTITMTATVGGVSFDVDFTSSTASNRLIGAFIVPSGATYRVHTSLGISLLQWVELR